MFCHLKNILEILLIRRTRDRIESQSQDLTIDSRKIVEFVAVANNFPLDQLVDQENERRTYVSRYGYKL